jgi:hypothetical protein
MRALLIPLMLFATAAGAVEYKCKDAQGNWTKEACTGAAAPATPASNPTSAHVAANNPEALKVKAHCAAKWEADFRMQKYCVDQQTEAAMKLGPEMSKVMDNPNSELAQALGVCVAKWTDEAEFRDWRMILYCWEQQKKAYRALGKN